ncbi:DUF1697 domain-containing protein [Verrucosispora sp. WMMA2121]|nr:DUF1697 domain-containing protein [Verrucosispora sp. WMMA2121]MCZ7421782.1 DUF1697 domain-containing protein [Verrucosispora sp. WMMA2121]
MARYAVLLRGVNLGKAKRVGMADERQPGHSRMTPPSTR